ncbi:MAG: hypothetical protein M2R45_01613 [Verrucomicrobia subdivision 3 bacterium]|nr:hypothetical protein [Limisphaerales bacterium]MCS1412765.1 hypothetical protein [Limisphaerales bacterium]
MQAVDFDETIEQIVAQDSRYTLEAYYFVREALDYTQKKKLGRNKKIQQPQHISGQELLDGARKYTLKEYGPMGFYVLAEWGIHKCEDIGEIVFNMVASNLLSKTDKDTREDFAGGFIFEEALVWPFLPPSKLSKKAKLQADASKGSPQ